MLLVRTRYNIIIGFVEKHNAFLLRDVFTGISL